MIFLNEQEKSPIDNIEYIKKDGFENENIKIHLNNKKKNDKIIIDENLNNSKIDIKNITPVSIDPEIFSSNNNKEKDNDEEVFGIKKSEIYNAIDEKLNSKRNSNKTNILKLKKLNSGLDLPLCVLIIVILLILISIPLFIYYFDKLSKISLIENLISDRSILLKISKKQQEEVEQMKKKLLEEIELLKRNREMIAKMIEEEYLLAVSEIESGYNRRIEALKNAGYSIVEYENRKISVDGDRVNSLKKAGNDRDEKMERQMTFFDQRLKDLNERYAKLMNTDINIGQMRIEPRDILFTESKINAKSSNTENSETGKVRTEIRNLSQKSERVKNVYMMVNQLIRSAISDFDNNNADASIRKFDSVVNYYNSQIDLVNSDNDLKSKMNGDLLLIRTTKELMKQMTLPKNNEVETKSRVIFNEATALFNIKKYQEAANLYYNLIMKYPSSSYIAETTNNLMKINDILVSGKSNEETIRGNFRSEYSKFLTALNRNELKKARDSYFNALNIIINPYTNETIPKFHEVEERYIASILEANRSGNSRIEIENLKKKYDDDIAKLNNRNSTKERELENKYKLEIENLKKKHDDDIAKLSSGNTTKDNKVLEDRYKLEIENLKKKYDDDIAKLNSSNTTKDNKVLEDRYKLEIENLKKKYDDDIAKLNSSNSTKERELENKYKLEIENLKKKYESDTAKLSSSSSSSSSSTKELEEKHKKELDDLRKKYESELEKTKKELTSVDTKSIENRLESEYRKKLEKIENDYKSQINNLKREQYSSKPLESVEKISGDNDIYIGRVIERIDKTVTFQLLSREFTSYIANGDKLTVIRRDRDGKERFVGHINVISVTNSSLFARGVIFGETKLDIYPNDILVLPKKTGNK